MKSRVFDWRRRRSWLDAMRRYAGHILTDDLRVRLSRERPNCWSDDLTWIGDSEFVVSEFVSAMTNYYSHFKAFHGCRPQSLRSYCNQGLLGQRSVHLVGIFRKIFSDVPKEDIEHAIAKFTDRGQREQGSIWLVGDDESLVKECGHYIIQGSEFLMALAANLGLSSSGEDYRYRLRNYGVPTILEINLPIALVPSYQHIEIAKSLLSEWGQIVARRPLGIGNDGPTFVVHQDIPPSCICGHYHPAKIADPHQGYRPYINKTLSCDSCA